MRWPSGRSEDLIRGALLLALPFIGPGVVGGQAVERDVPYVDDPHPEQVMDLYWPEGGFDATILFVHGGGLHESGQRRDSELYRHVCGTLVRDGLGCATVDYRLFPAFHWPAMALDVTAAVREVRSRIRARGGDPGRLFLFGHSSGCHLVAVLGTNGAYLADVGLAPGDLAGVIAMGCTLDHYDAALRGATADGIRDRFRGSSDTALYRTAENWIAGNPAHHVGAHVPPTLVVVARNERFFPAILEQGARFVRRLKEEDVPAELVIVPGTHRSSIADLAEPDDPTRAAIRAFIADPVLATSGGE